MNIVIVGAASCILVAGRTTDTMGLMCGITELKSAMDASGNGGVVLMDNAVPNDRITIHTLRPSVLYGRSFPPMIDARMRE